MPQKFDTRRKDLLLGAERHERLNPAQLLRTLGLREGDTMADIGSGPGFFALPAAEIVGPNGTVYAADIQGEMLTAVRSRAAEHGYTTIHVVKTSETEVPLPQESCDFVLLAFTLHEIESHATFLRRLARILKPDGRLAVLEWQKIEQPNGPPVEDRISQETLLADAQAAGLENEEQFALNDDQYACTFRRAPAR